MPIVDWFVKGISYSATEDDIIEALAPFGKVSRAAIVADDFGKSRGFAFVTIMVSGDPDDAMFKAFGTALMGRRLHIEKIRPKPDPTTTPPPGWRPGVGER